MGKNNDCGRGGVINTNWWMLAGGHAILLLASLDLIHSSDGPSIGSWVWRFWVFRVFSCRENVGALGLLIREEMANVDGWVDRWMHKHPSMRSSERKGLMKSASIKVMDRPA